MLLLGRRPDRLDEAAIALRAAHPGASVHAAVADVTSPADVGAAATVARDVLGQVGIVVANAGSPAARPTADLAQLADSWLSSFRANTLGAVLLVSALDPLLVAPGGRIVIIGSSAAQRGNSTPSYAAAKGALEAWVRTLANKYGPRGITANVIAPGYTADTELIAGRIPPERHERLVASISLGRSAVADEIAAVATFLASPAASYLTGQTINVDGGLRI